MHSCLSCKSSIAPPYRKKMNKSAGRLLSGLDLLLLVLSLHLVVNADIRRCVKQIALVRPHRREFPLNLVSPLLQLVDLRQAFAQLLHLLLDLHLLALRSDALEFPAVALVADAQLKVKSVVLFERSPRRNGNESYR